MEDFDIYSILVGSLLKIMLGYILIGIIVVMLTETLISIVKLRGRVLKRGIKNVIDDEEIQKKISEHPLIKPFGKYPAYINFNFFADAIEDSVKLEKVYANQESNAETKLKIRNSNFKKFLLGLIKRNKSLKQFKKSLITWFLDYMRDLSGIYKKYVKLIITTITLIIVVSCNMDSVEIFKTFYKDDLARKLINQVEDKDTSVEKLEGVLKNSFPIGWEVKTGASNSFSASKVVGFIISIVFISIASIVVFDISGKYVNIRNVNSPYTKN